MLPRRPRGGECAAECSAHVKKRVGRALLRSNVQQENEPAGRGTRSRAPGQAHRVHVPMNEPSAPQPPRRAPSGDSLTRVEKTRGVRPGDGFMRVVPHPGFRRLRPGHIVARQSADEPKSGLGRAVRGVRRFLFGAPIRSEDEPHERVNVFTGLAVFASDNISSSAYATEEIMRVLVLAGLGALALTMPITIAITLVLAIVVLSYQQTIGAYPSGGGSYIVASDNLGPFPALV